MLFAVTQGIPNVFTAGDAASFSVTDGEHPASSWTSIIYFKDQVTGAVLNFTRDSVDGDKHVFELTNAEIATLVAGKNFVCLAFSDGTHRQVSDWEEVTVLSDPTAADVPTYAESQVTALKAAIATLQATPFQSVNFSGQSYTQNSLPELQKQLTYYRAEVIRENKIKLGNRGLGPFGTPVSPKFVSLTQSIPPFNRV